MTENKRFDVIVIGGGPAGSAMAWALASKGVSVAVVERMKFPREKVCGDFVEPAGLRILEMMGCSEALGLKTRQPITLNRVYFGPRVAYQGDIPYYDGEHGLPPHGLVIPRHELDTVLLENARANGATVIFGATASAIRRVDGTMHVDVKEGTHSSTLSAPLVVGADGVQSVVAKAFGLRRTDRRFIGVSQRAYLEGIETDPNEATIWFDEDHIPGYGWMFPTPDGRANMGVGLLGETSDRFGMSVQQCFREAVERLRFRHPGCKDARIASKPLGGSVHVYSGIQRNSFAGGILVGDAGSFADPVTAEGITQGMESAIIGSRTLIACLESGSFEEPDLARFERDFRAYFDPSMRYLSFCATLMRNRHFSEFVFRATRQGFEEAQADREFGRIAGAGFGGLNVQPLAMAGEIWKKVSAHLLKGGIAELVRLASGRGIASGTIVADMALFRNGWRASRNDDPEWHHEWLCDLFRSVGRLGPSMKMAENPRVRGPFVESMV